MRNKKIVILWCFCLSVFGIHFKYQSSVVTQKTLENTATNTVHINRYVPLEKYVANLEDNVFDCVEVKIQPTFNICIYNYKEDKYISNTIIEKGLYQPENTESFKYILNRCTDCIFIDLGCNLGYFSLLSSALGHKTVSYDILSSNLNKLSKASEVSKLKISIYKYGVSGSENPHAYAFEGDSSIGERGQGTILNSELDQDYVPAYYEKFQTITISRIFHDLQMTYVINQTSPPIILKLDLDTHECSVFEENSNVFINLSIPYIIMRWNFIAYDPYKPKDLAYTRPKKSICSLENLKNMIHFLIDVYEYIPYSLDTIKPLLKRDLTGSPRSNWLVQQKDPHVLWIHRNVNTKKTTDFEIK